MQGVKGHWPASDSNLREIAIATKNDCQVATVCRYVCNGWPEYQRDISHDAKEFYLLNSVGDFHHYACLVNGTANMGFGFVLIFV